MLVPADALLPMAHDDAASIHPTSAISPAAFVLVRRRLFVFPGMGATSEMYRGLGRHLRDATYCEWPSHVGCHTFSDLADSCIAAYSIQPGDVVAGSSMGGMVAAEIAAKLRHNDLILIGSCLDPRLVPARRLAPLAARLLNDQAMRLIGTKGNFSLLARMANNLGAPFIRWSLQTLPFWPGIQAGALRSVHSIHGLLDPIIPISGIRATERVATGGHFIAISHPHRVRLYIEKAILSLANRPNRH